MRRLVLLAFLSACRISGTFECGLDEVCRRGDDLGVCEVEGYCSFGDAMCPSGRRYADNAGDGLANECVSETAEPLTCRERWTTSIVRFGAVSDLGVSSPLDDRDPWISAVGNLLLFSSNRTGSAGYDIYLSSRADITVPFPTPALVPALNSTSTDSRATLSADLLTVYLNSDRTGTKGGIDVWRATRTTATGQFAAPDQATVATFNSADNEYDVFLSHDGLKLYVALGRSGMPQRIATASRATTADSFGVPSAIVELDNGSSNADPSVTDDELLMVFTSTRTAPTTGGNLWYTTRASVTEKWLPARLVPDVNIDGDEGDPYLSADACTLYFARNVAPAGPFDLVYAGVQ